MTPDIHTRHDFAKVGIDNGAWGCSQRKVEWTPDRWVPLAKLRDQLLRAAQDAAGKDL